MQRTKIDFANSCADARQHQGRAQALERDRAVMFVMTDDGHEFYLYFDTMVWHECTSIHEAWSLHQRTLHQTPR
ncbi:MAG TPA: hypothetical protein VIY48_06025 [Candidatus Paceibacterota bacterium]